MPFRGGVMKLISVCLQMSRISGKADASEFTLKVVSCPGDRKPSHKDQANNEMSRKKGGLTPLISSVPFWCMLLMLQIEHRKVLGRVGLVTRLIQARHGLELLADRRPNAVERYEFISVHCAHSHCANQSFYTEKTALGFKLKADKGRSLWSCTAAEASDTGSTKAEQV